MELVALTTDVLRVEAYLLEVTAGQLRFASSMGKHGINIQMCKPDGSDK